VPSVIQGLHRSHQLGGCDAGLGLLKALGPLPNMLCPCIGVGSGSHGRHSAEEAGARTGGSFTS